MSLGLFTATAASAQSPTIFLARPGTVTTLIDLNADGDFLDFAETQPYAAAMPAQLGAIAVSPTRVFVIDATTGTILALADTNDDHDALDFGEVSLFGIPPSGPPVLAGLISISDELCFSVNTTSGNLIRFEDLNHDGDALDFAEAAIVANGLAPAATLAARPDGVILAAQSLTTFPVLILQDRTNDADYLDFAESLSYVENTTSGTGLVAVTNQLAYLARPTDGRVMKLHDLTGDDDALDFAEVTTWADAVPNVSRLALEPSGALLAACADPAGSVYRLRDANNDGDALDFGEAIIVATGQTTPSGIAIRLNTNCLAGDMNADGIVDIVDAPLLAAELLNPGSAPTCRADVNGDSSTDGRDIRAFTQILLP